MYLIRCLKRVNKKTPSYQIFIGLEIVIEREAMFIYNIPFHAF